MKKILLEVEVIDGEIVVLEQKLEGAEASMKNLDKASKKTASSVDEVAKNGGAIATLDRLTGGAASQMRDLFESTKLFNLSLKATKTALIATGIGAFVVALGLVVAYWDDIKGFISGANVELDRQISKQQKLVDEQQRALNLLESSDNILKLQGKTQSEINKLKQEEIAKLIKLQEGELKLQKARLQSLQDIRDGGSKGLEGFFRTGAIMLTRFAELVDEALGWLGLGTSLKNTVFSGTNSVIESIFGSNEDISETQAKIDALEDSLTNLENTAAGITLSERGTGTGRGGDVSSVGDAGLTSGDAIKLTSAQILSDALKDISEERLRDENLKLQQGVLAEKKAAEEKRRIAQIENEQKLMLASDTLGQLANLFAANSKAAKIAGTAQALINTYLGVTQVLSNKTVLPEPFGTINKIASIATVLASGLNAVKQINSVQVPSGGGGGGSIQSGGGIGSIPQPEFNIVGNTGINQIGQVIGEGLDRPTRSYVVYGDIEKAGQLEKEAIEGATI